MNKTLNFVFPVFNYTAASFQLEQLNRKDLDETANLNNFENSSYKDFGTAEDLLNNINENVDAFSDYGRYEYLIIRSLSTGFFHKEDAIYVFEYRSASKQYKLVDDIDTIMSFGEDSTWRYPVSTWFH